MRLYHASTSIIEKPDVLHSRDKLDFGKGFYLTTIRGQAVRYAERFTRRGKEAFINEYELDEEHAVPWKKIGDNRITPEG